MKFIKHFYSILICLTLFSCNSGDGYVGTWQSDQNPNKIVRISKAGKKGYFIFVDNYEYSTKFFADFKEDCFANKGMYYIFCGSKEKLNGNNEQFSKINEESIIRADTVRTMIEN